MTTHTTPCSGRSYVYDVLIDRDSNSPTYRIARNEAATLCARCPIRDRCHAENADESWVAALRGLVNWRDPTLRATCGTTAGVSAHRYNRERNCTACLACAAARQRVKKRQRRRAA